MPIRILACLYLMWSCASVRAATVAFLQLRNHDGSVLQLEPDGRFAHVAIAIGRHWLHAHPRGGVQLVDDLLPYGQSITLLENPDVPDPSLARAAAWIGKAFDGTFTWGRTDATYCARLIADLLGVPPKTMEFKQEGWRPFVNVPIGQPGISPDELYAALRARGFLPVRPRVAAHTCTDLLVE